MFKNLKFKAIKTAFLALLPFLLHLKFTFAGGAPGVTWPPLSTVFPDVPHLAATVLAWYELVVRFVPSLSNNSIVTLLHDLLNALIPNAAIDSDGNFGEHSVEHAVTTYPTAGGTGLAA